MFSGNAAESLHPSTSLRPTGAVFDSLAASAVLVGYRLGWLGAPRRSHSPSSRQELAGQHAHAPNSKAVWQQELALAKEELQITSRAMAAILCGRNT